MKRSTTSRDRLEPVRRLLRLGNPNQAEKNKRDFRMYIKREPIEPYCFLAKHARGAQPEWLEYFNERLFPQQIEMPSGYHVSVRVDLEEEDKDTDTYSWEHTRFRFIPIIEIEDLIDMVKTIKFHYLQSSFLIAIYEEKFDKEAMETLTRETVPICGCLNYTLMKHRLDLSKNFYERLIYSINFVDECRKAVEFYKMIFPKVVYNMARLHFTLEIEADEESTAEWVQQCVRWGYTIEENDRDDITHAGADSVGRFIHSIPEALMENARKDGYPEWFVSNFHEDYDGDYVPEGEIFHLKLYFSKGRMCLGLELYDDERIHEYFLGGHQHHIAGTTAMIAQILSPDPYDIVLDLTHDDQDVMVNCIANFSSHLMCYSFMTTQNMEEIEAAMWSYIRMEELAALKELEYTCYYDLVRATHWTDVLNQDAFLAKMDSVYLPIFSEEMHACPFDLEMIKNETDHIFNFVVKVINKLSVGAKITVALGVEDSESLHNLLLIYGVGMEKMNYKTLADTEMAIGILKCKKIAETHFPIVLRDGTFVDENFEPIRNPFDLWLRESFDISDNGSEYTLNDYDDSEIDFDVPEPDNYADVFQWMFSMRPFRLETMQAVIQQGRLMIEEERRDENGLTPSERRLIFSNMGNFVQDFQREFDNGPEIGFSMMYRHFAQRLYAAATATKYMNNRRRIDIVQVVPQYPPPDNRRRIPIEDHVVPDLTLNPYEDESD